MERLGKWKLRPIISERAQGIEKFKFKEILLENKYCIYYNTFPKYSFTKCGPINPIKITFIPILVHQQPQFADSNPFMMPGIENNNSKATKKCTRRMNILADLWALSKLIAHICKPSK